MHFIHKLSHRGLFFISDLISHWEYGAPIWKTFERLGLQDEDKDLWLNTISVFQGAGFSFQPAGDRIVWGGSYKGPNICVKDLYTNLIAEASTPNVIPGFTKAWKWSIPHKILLFNWLLWKGRILTWENLQKRGMIGPGCCIICKQQLESVSHLFFECKPVLGFWELISRWAGYPSWSPQSQTQAFDFWGSKGAGIKALPFYVCWEVWRSRNNMLFNEGLWDPHRMYRRILVWLQTPSASDEIIKDLSIRYRPHEVNIPALFFDGAQQEGVCGCGAWLKLENGERYNISWNGGPGTNSKAELLALWSGLLVALHLRIPCIDIYGDSQVVIGGISGRTTLRSPHLCGWVERIIHLLSQFQRTATHHIYRELNSRAEKLSKLGLAHEFGFISVTYISENRAETSYSFPL